MKVIHIITRMILGGAQENTLYTCEGLHRRGHEVTLITGPALGPEGQLLDRARRGGYRVIELDGLRRAINPFRDVPCYRRLKKLIRELTPDIVHTHSAKAGILGRRAAGKVRAAQAATCCPRVERFRAVQIACSAKPRIVHTVHGLAFHPYQSGLLNRLYIAIERSAARSTDAFISVAEAMTAQMLAVGIGRREQFTKVYSGLETAYFQTEPSAERIAAVRKEFGIPRQACVMATVARLFHLKGHEYIIESAREIARRHPEAVWLFIGDGVLREQYERRISELGLTDRFRFAGLVAPERIGELLHAGDILVHCSLREGLARALPQALLCGKPVVSFEVDGAREVVIDNRTGFLVAPKDVEALTEALHKLIENPGLRQRLGREGRSMCAKEFAHELMVDRIEQVYKSQITME